MSYSVSYLKEKFGQAVRELATGEGDAKSRVGPAHQRFWIIPIEDFPEEVRNERKEIETLMTQIEAKEGHTIPENLRLMTNSTASEIASLILEISNCLSGMPDDWPPRRAE